MARILFIMKYPLDRPYSVKQKMEGQMNAVRRLGYEVDFISFDTENIYLENGSERKIIGKTTNGKSRLYYHLISFHDIYSAADKMLKTREYDAVYFRYGPLNSAGCRLFRTAAARSRLIVEIPTFPPESERQRSLARRIYISHSYRLWKKYAHCISLFTAIGEKADSYLGRPLLNIDNGIDVEALPVKVNAPAPDGRIHMLAVACMANWHGYDRVIRGMAESSDQRISEYVLDLVGDDGDGSLEEWKKLAAELGILDRVFFHGHKTGDDLTHFFDIASVGLGGLGMYRKNMDSGSLLKSREYMGRGLPFIYANDDPDLTEDMPWCIRFPNDDTSIDMSIVADFAEEVSKDNEISKKMREHAFKYMSWDTQFIKIIDALKSII